MSKWTSIRDLGETAATLAGNYYLPGSSLVTDHLVSKGSQKQLGSILGQVAQAGTGLSGGGAFETSSGGGIPSASSVGGGWTNFGNNVGGAFGDSTLGTDIGNGITGAVNKVSDGLSGAGHSLSSALGFGGGDTVGQASTISGPGSYSFANNPEVGKLSLSNPAAVSAGLSGGGADYANAIIPNSAPSAAGAVGGGASSFGSGATGLSGVASGSSYGGLNAANTLGTLVGGVNSYSANQKAQKDLINSQNQALSQIQPYQQSGTAANSKLSDYLGLGSNGSGATSADILAASPGYQFQLDQGNQALDRKNAASGSYFSGAALKGAQDYGQGLANQTAQQYYSNLANQSGQGLNAASGAANINQSTGAAKANAQVANSGIFNQTLSSLLSGSGNKRAMNIGGQTVYI